MPNFSKTNRGKIVLVASESVDAKIARRWLVTGKGEVPDLHALAQTVNAYDRMSDWDQINQWLGEIIDTLYTNGPASSQNQELLDFIFLMVRKDRFIDGLLASYEPVVKLVISELQRRVPLQLAQMAN